MGASLVSGVCGVIDSCVDSLSFGGSLGCGAVRVISTLDLVPSLSLRVMCVGCWGLVWRD